MNTNTKPHLELFKWKPGTPSPNKNGRPKSLKNILKNEHGMTLTQTNELILNLLTYTKCEIDEICNNEDEPIFTRIISKALLKSYNNGNLYAIESLLNRTHGMPKQQTELSTTNEKPIFVSLDLNVK